MSETVIVIDGETDGGVGVGEGEEYGLYINHFGTNLCLLPTDQASAITIIHIMLLQKV